MAMRIFVGLALLGFCVGGPGAAAAGPSTCAGLGPSGCGAADHSLLQVASHSPRRMPASASRDDASTDVGLVEAHGQGRALKERVRQALAAASNPDNRTLSNITSTVEELLEDLETDVDLLVLGNHKLCGAEEKNAARVKTLMNALVAPGLLQLGADEEPVEEDDETGVEAIERTHDALDRDERASVGRHEQNNLKLPWLPESQASRTLANITGDVSKKVASVEAVMNEIQTEEGKNEVLGTEVSNRIHVLISLLQTETKECEADEPTTPAPVVVEPGPVLTTPPSDVADVTAVAADYANAINSIAAASTGSSLVDGSSGQSARASLALTQRHHERIAALLGAHGPDSANVTFANLTTKIKKELASLEDNIGALVKEKNELGEANSQSEAHLDNLEDKLQPSDEAKPVAQLALISVKSTKDVGLNRLFDSVPKDTKKQMPENVLHDKKTQSNEEDPSAELQKRQSGQRKKQMSKRHKRAMRRAEQKKKEEEAKKAERQDAEESDKTSEEHFGTEKEDIRRNQNAAIHNIQAKAPNHVNFHDMPFNDLSGSIDDQVDSLEDDLGDLQAEKRQACWASKKALNRLEVIAGVLSTLEC